MSTIRKFNAYCEQLAALHDPAWSIPIPTPLPTKLNDLRNHQALMEDIWISPAARKIPCWVEDQDLAAVELVLHIPENEIFYFALHEHRSDILSLSSRWANPLVSSSQFNSQTNGATVLAESLSGSHPQILLFWLSPTTIDVEALEDAPEEAHMDLSDIIGLQEAAHELEHKVFADLFSEEPGLLKEDAEDDELTVTTTILWELPQNMSLDMTQALPPNQYKIIASKVAPIQQPGMEGAYHLSFMPEDVVILANPTGCLNNVCINGCIALLFSLIKLPDADRCHAPNMFGTVNMECTVDSRLSWSEQ
ncbi:hypothetical protein SCLCIDRAFT_20491 [Scleroderma citrinum Foug A]|uniref:Uncharacterized protein n=1 Tax=Scleroderma citrinum Foug A TaxID=1036808 RepID=A0A0C3A2Z7_9AGAM|nr:hypothetical protein SCLCIDRAFT_20491 [Scleroderma citrinum Foug A]